MNSYLTTVTLKYLIMTISYNVTLYLIIMTLSQCDFKSHNCDFISLDVTSYLLNTK